MKLPAILSTALLLLAAPARADGPQFRELSWPAGPRITDRIAVDLNKDGAKDLILVRGRQVSIYLQRGGSYTPENPTQRFNFVDKAILWTTGDVEHDGFSEILYLTNEGVFYYKWEGERLSFVPHELLRTDSILKTASEVEVRWKQFYLDLDGDGEPDLLLPSENCFLLYRGLGGGKFAPPERLEMSPDVYLDGGGNSPSSQAVSSYWYPQVVAGDWDGTGRRALFVSQREQILIFMQQQGADGRPHFGPRPTYVLPLKFTGPLPEGRFQFDIQLPTKFADVDGDGITDIIATHIGRATTYIYKGRPGRADLAKPDAILKFPGITFLNFLVDLDNDGRMDLVLARTDRPGLLDLVKVLITKEIPVEVLFFFGRAGDEPYPKEPDYRREIEIPILFSSAQRGVNIGTSSVISVLGDFDGDGKKDLLLRSSNTTLAVYRGLGRSFSDEPAFELRVHDMDGYRFLEPVADDLNGDGISDLILTYYSWDGKADRMSVLLSPGNPRRAEARAASGHDAGGPGGK
jgi:hypothetical protein